MAPATTHANKCSNVEPSLVEIVLKSNKDFPLSLILVFEFSDLLFQFGNEVMEEVCESRHQGGA